MKILLLGINNNELRELATELSKLGKTVFACNNLSKFGAFIKAKNPDCVVAYSDNGTEEYLPLFKNKEKLIVLDNNYKQGSYGEFKVLPKNTSAVSIVQHLSGQSKNPKVLLVDDNTFVLDFFSELLTLNNIEHIAVSSFDSAINHIQRQPYLLIISDMNIHGRTAVELLDIYKKTHTSPTQTIIISGSTEDEIKDKHENFTADVFLLKPVSEEVFLKQVFYMLRLNKESKQDLQATASSNYSIDEIRKLIKGDELKLKTCVDDFIRVLNGSISATKIVMNGGDIESVRIPYHDILNLCSYFGAHQLNVLIAEFKTNKEKTQVSSLLSAIQTEQENVLRFLENVKIN